MNQDQLKQLLELSVSGEKQAREKLISHYHPFILKEAQKICRRSLEWGQDEELSIALIAFNESIDAYREARGDSFENLSRLVIRRRLVDYFRRAGKHSLVVMPGDDFLSHTAVEEDWEQNERKQEVEAYKRLLNKHDITFEMLVKAQPKHRETREKLKRAARIMAENQDLIDYLNTNGKLPIRRLCEKTGLTPRILERGRIYVIALALLLSENEFPHLQEYARELADAGAGG